MTTLQHSPVNRDKLLLLQRLLQQALDEILRRGFHGAASLEIAVQDGTIQHVRKRVEQLEK